MAYLTSMAFREFERSGIRSGARAGRAPFFFYTPLIDGDDTNGRGKGRFFVRIISLFSIVFGASTIG